MTGIEEIEKDIYRGIDMAFHWFKKKNIGIESICNKTTMEEWYNFIVWCYAQDGEDVAEDIINSEFDFEISKLMQSAIDEASGWWCKYNVDHQQIAEEECRASCTSCNGIGFSDEENEKECEECEGTGKNQEDEESHWEAYEKAFNNISSSVNTDGFNQLSTILLNNTKKDTKEKSGNVNMKFNKSKDFIDTINNISKEGKDIQIKLHPKKYAFFEELLRWGEWNGKDFEISGKIFLKRAEVEWEEDLDSLIEQLEGIEISELGNDFYGWDLLGDDGGYPEANEDGIKWFSADKKEIQLNDKELKEFKEVGVDGLWDEAGFENEDSVEMMMDEGGMWKIIVTIGDDNFALISEEYFEQCDDEGNIQYNQTESTDNETMIEDGLHKEYYDNGQLKYQVEFKSGKITGQSKYYYESGELQSEGMFQDGNRDGIWKGYYKNGELRKMCEFKNGEALSLEEWDENGKKIKQ